MATQSADTQNRRSTGQIILLCIVVLAAFFLRVYRLGAQSLWYDEGVSWYMTTMSLPRLTVWTANDIQPPLYYYLLWFWVRVAGEGEFSLRFLSAAFGTLVVPAGWLLARRLFGGRKAPALLAAAILAIHPLHVYYSQEARMYTLLAFLGISSSLLLLRISRPPRARAPLALYVVVSAAMLYTHYFAFFLLFAHAVYFLYRWWASGRPGVLLLRGLLAAVGTGLLYAPWLPFMLTRYGEDVSYWPGRLKPAEALVQLAVTFSAGETVAAKEGMLLAVVYALVMVVCTAMIIAREKSGAAVFLLAYLLVPVVLVLMLSYSSPKFNPRYSMLSSPALVLILAGGIALLWTEYSIYKTQARVIAAFFTASILATGVYSLSNWYTDPEFSKPDFRRAALAVKAQIAPDETVLLNSGHFFPVWAYYFGWDNWHRLPDSEILDVNRVLRLDAAGELDRILAGKSGAWLVTWQHEVTDPNRVLQLLLETNGELAYEDFLWQVDLRHYRFRPGTDFACRATLAGLANFGGQVELLGVEQVRDDVVVFFWQGKGLHETEYRLQVSMVDEAGRIWGGLAGYNPRPSAYEYPPARWSTGEVVPGWHWLKWKVGTPPGTYRLRIGLASDESPGGLDVLDAMGNAQGHEVVAGEIRLAESIQPPPESPLHTADSLVENPYVSLLEVTLPYSQVHPGDKVDMELLWRVEETPPGDFTVIFGWPDGEEAEMPFIRDYPSSLWRPGEILLGVYTLRVPIRAVGYSAITMRSEMPSGTEDLHTHLAGVEVLPTDRVFEPPEAMDVSCNTVFGDAITLLGADVDREPRVLDLTLYWQLDEDAEETEKSYTVFLHLLDGEEKVVVGADHVPVGGTRPTTGWIPGEVVADEVRLPLPADLSGEYSVEAGLYDASDPSFPRLPLENGESRVIITTIRVGD